MADYAPGPITLGHLPLAPRIVHAGTFAALLEPVVNTLGASDDVLGAHQLAIAGNTGDGLDATFTATIGAADAIAAGQPAPGADQTGGRLVDAGAGTRAYHDAVQQFLPQPTLPIGQGFREFPTPDFGNPGNNGVEPGDPGAGGVA